MSQRVIKVRFTNLETFPQVLATLEASGWKAEVVVKGQNGRHDVIFTRDEQARNARRRLSIMRSSKLIVVRALKAYRCWVRSGMQPALNTELLPNVPSLTER